jgi:hypothetical protein
MNIKLLSVAVGATTLGNFTRYNVWDDSNVDSLIEEVIEWSFLQSGQVNSFPPDDLYYKFSNKRR